MKYLLQGQVLIVAFCFAIIPVAAQQEKSLSNETFLKEYNSVPKPNQSPILIENVRIIDGYGGDPVEKGYVLIKEGLILQVGSGSPAPALRQGAVVSDGTGKSLLPGLIDAHLHTVNDNSIIHKFLNNGVTSFRDPGHPFSFYQSIHFADKPLPRIFLTGAHLDYPPVAYGQQATLVKNGAHASQMVTNNFEAGGTAVKIYFRLPLKFYKDVVETAKMHNIPVVAHLELVNVLDAIRAGVTGIEHVTSYGTSIADESVKEHFIAQVDQDNNARGVERYRLWSTVNLTSKKVKEVINESIKRSVVLCPTLAAFEKQPSENGEEDFRVKGFQNMLGFVKRAHKEGLRIVIGSHSYVEYAKPGEAYFREMELLQMAGLTPLEIIRAGTVFNAEYFGISGRLGSIEEGKAADLILVNGDPSVDLQSIRRVDAVLVNGVWVKN